MKRRKTAAKRKRQKTRGKPTRRKKERSERTGQERANSNGGGKGKGRPQPLKTAAAQRDSGERRKQPIDKKSLKTYNCVRTRKGEF